MLNNIIDHDREWPHYYSSSSELQPYCTVSYQPSNTSREERVKLQKSDKERDITCGGIPANALH